MKKRREVICETEQREIRFGYIDSLRALAALLVFFTHAISSYLEKHPHLFSWTHKIHFYPGLLGIVLFFQISGFVVPFSFKGSAQQFLIRRFFRLFPLFWINLPIYVLLRCFVYGFETPAPLDFFAWFSMAPTLFGKTAIGHWTLELELLFYALCLIAFLFRKIHTPSFLSSIVCTSFALALIPTTSFSRFIFLYLALMFWGALWRKKEDLIPPFSRLILYGFPLLLGCLIPVISLFSPLRPPETLFTIAAAIILFILGTTVFRLEFPWLRYLGKISYSLFLFHVPCIMIFDAISLFPSVPYYLKDPPFWPYLSILTITVLLVSSFTYRFIEVPSLALARKLESSFAFKRAID